MSAQQIAARYVGAIDQIQIFGVADREVDFNGIQLGDRCEERFRADKVYSWMTPFDQSESD